VINDEGRHIVAKPPDENQPESHRPEPGDRSLRDELLRDLLGDSLSLSHIDSVVAYDYPTEPLSARQSRVITAIGSLLADGLLVVGDPGFSDEPVEPWKLSTEDALALLHERYVTQYDDFAKWGWSIWFELTASGERVAEGM
jgi:hypothetical protein